MRVRHNSRMKNFNTQRCSCATLGVFHHTEEGTPRMHLAFPHLLGTVPSYRALLTLLAGGRVHRQLWVSPHGLAWQPTNSTQFPGLKLAPKVQLLCSINAPVLARPTSPTAHRGQHVFQGAAHLQALSGSAFNSGPFPPKQAPHMKSTYQGKKKKKKRCLAPPLSNRIYTAQRTRTWLWESSEAFPKLTRQGWMYWGLSD